MKRCRCYNSKGRIEGRLQATAPIRPDITSRASAAFSQSLGATEYQLLALLDFRELRVDDLLLGVMSARAAGRFRTGACAAGGPA